MSYDDFNLNMPFPKVFPETWKSKLSGIDFMQFRNLDHFKFFVSKITQKDDNKCNINYKKALDMLIKGETDIDKKSENLIREKVKSNLLKRGLITDEVYEAFRYTEDGTKVDIDVGKFSSGEPDCVISPARDYIEFFYELYINISYSRDVSNKTVKNNIIKLLSTIEELERNHINIKISLILPISSICTNREKYNYFGYIPLFHHKHIKSIETMSSVINERLLRKFFFAILENEYGSDLSGNYGYAINMPKSINIGNSFDEAELFNMVLSESGYNSFIGSNM